MSSRFHLKIAVSILVVFGLLILGYVLYEPVWYRVQASRLCSNDETTRNAAAIAVAGKGKSAVPFLKEWLKSENDRLVVGACDVVLILDNSLWKQTLPEIIELLHKAPSIRTSAAAHVVFEKDYAFEFGHHGGYYWEHFEDDMTAKRNICIYLLSGPHEEGCGDIAAHELGRTGDRHAYLPLCDALENSQFPEVRRSVAIALGELRDNRAVRPLINSLLNDAESVVRDFAALGLADIEGKEINSALEVAAGKRCHGAVIALAWRHGGEYLVALNEMLLHDTTVFDDFIDGFAAYTLGRWGNTTVLEDMIFKCLPHPWAQRFWMDVISRMPDGFPEYNFKLDFLDLDTQAEAMKEWYEKHKHRLAWDDAKLKYYLKPEGIDDNPRR